MSITQPSSTILVPTVEEVPRISDAERAELLASLEEGRADAEPRHAVSKYSYLSGNPGHPPIFPPSETRGWECHRAVMS